MAENKSTFTEAQLKSELQAQNEVAKEDFKQVLTKMDALLKTYEHGQAMETQMKRLQKTKSAEATSLIMQMHRENESLDINYLKARHKMALDEIRRRLSLALDISGREEGSVSTFEELAELKQVVLPLAIRDLDVDKILDEVPVTYLDIVAKLDSKPEKKLSVEEKELVLAEIKKIANMQNPPKANEVRGNISKYPGLALLGHMNPEQRFERMRELLDDQRMIKTIVGTCASNYLTVEQGVELLKEMAKKHPDFSENCSKAIGLIQSKKFGDFKLEVERLGADAAKSLKRNFGKNYAGKLLSLKGAFVWEVGRGWGAVTMLANFLAKVDLTQVYKNPMEFTKQVASLGKDPAFMAGAGALAASAEIISGGFGKGMITQSFLKLIDDSAKENSQVKAEKKLDFVRKSLGDRPRVAELYFMNAEAIEAQFRKDPKKLDLKTLGVDYASLDKKFKDKEMGGMSEEDYNELIPQFAAIFNDDKVGIGRKTAISQKTFINESRDAAGLKQFS